MMRWRLSLLILCALAVHGRLVEESDYEKFLRESNGELYKILKKGTPTPLKEDETSPTETAITKEMPSISAESPNITEPNNETRKGVKTCDLGLDDQEREERICRVLARVNVFPKLSRPSFRSSLGSAYLFQKPDFSSLVDRHHSPDGRHPSNILQRQEDLTGVFHRLWEKRNKKPKGDDITMTSPEIYSWKPNPDIYQWNQSPQTHSRNSSPRKSKSTFRSRLPRIRGSRRG